METGHLNETRNQHARLLVKSNKTAKKKIRLWFFSVSAQGKRVDKCQRLGEQRCCLSAEMAMMGNGDRNTYTSVWRKESWSHLTTMFYPGKYDIQKWQFFPYFFPLLSLPPYRAQCVILPEVENVPVKYYKHSPLVRCILHFWRIYIHMYKAAMSVWCTAAQLSPTTNYSRGESVMPRTVHYKV
jgi:hypothetical protein